MAKYKFEDLQKEILKSLIVDKNDSIFKIALYDENLKTYSVTFNELKPDNPGIIDSIKRAVVDFTKVITFNSNFDIGNFKNNLTKNVIIGVSMNNSGRSAGDTVFDENRNLFEILADRDLVDSGVIYHELFHLASRGTNGHTFRLGLREGYTEALTHRYFSKSKLAYYDNVYYALRFEEIVGTEIMEKAYSKGDVSIIIESLKLDDMTIFNKFNDNMDLLLGSYYRINNDEALNDEDKRIARAKASLDECLEIFREGNLTKNRTI